MYFLQKRVAKADQPSSTNEAVHGERYTAPVNAESGCVVQPNPAYCSVAYMDHSARLGTITERGATAAMQLQVDGREGEIENIYEDVKVGQ